VASLDPIQDTLMTAWTALDTYHEAVAAIHTSAVPWQEQVDQANIVINLPITPITVNPVDYVQDTARHNAALIWLAEARVQLEMLLARRSEVDNAAIAALDTAPPPSWADQYAAFAAAGVTAEMLLSSVDSKTAMQDLMEKIIEGDVSAETINALNGLLSIHGDDTYWMSALYSAVGGAGITEIIHTLSGQLSGPAIGLGEITENDRRLAELAGRIRSGLAAATENWGPELSEAYVSDMLTGPLDGDPELPDASFEFTLALYRAEAVAYLFSGGDAASMPENLSVALAYKVDDLERNNPAGYTFDTYNGSPAFQPMLFDAVERIDAGEPYENREIMDEVGGWGHLPSAAFESLGNYPEASLEFLSPVDDADAGLERVEYWFHDKEWAEIDGYSGVSSLLFGAMQAEGGPTSLEYDASEGGVGQRASDLFTLAATQLMGNADGFIPENLSDEAAMDLASSSGVFFDAFADYMAGDEDFIADGVGSAHYTPFGSSEERWGPELKLEDFGKFIGAISGNPSGAVVIDTVAGTVSDGYFEIAQTSGSTAVVEEAMLRINSLDGFMDGAGVGANLAIAEREDTLTEAKIDAAVGAAGFVIGFIPMGSSLVEGAVGLLVDNLGPGAIEFVAGDVYHYDEAVANASDFGDASLKMARFENGQRMWELMQQDGSAFGATDYEVPREQYSGESADDYVEYCNNWYEGFIAQPEMSGFNTGQWKAEYEDGFLAGKGSSK